MAYAMVNAMILVPFLSFPFILINFCVFFDFLSDIIKGSVTRAEERGRDEEERVSMSK